MEKFWKVLKTILIILLIAVIAYGVYWLVKNFKKVTDKLGDFGQDVVDTITGGANASGEVITDTTGKLKLGNIYIKSNDDDQVNGFQYFLFEVYKDVECKMPTYYSLAVHFLHDPENIYASLGGRGYLYKSNDLQTWTNENQNDAQGVSPDYDYGIFYAKSTLTTYSYEFTTKGALFKKAGNLGRRQTHVWRPTLKILFSQGNVQREKRKTTSFNH